MQDDRRTSDGVWQGAIMLTGVRSEAMCDRLPSTPEWEAFMAEKIHTVTVTPLPDGRIHVAVFTPVDSDDPHFLRGLRAQALAQRATLDACFDAHPGES